MAVVRQFPFSPGVLFRGGVEGVWFDPSDLSTMFQDDTGRTPAAFGAPVGLILDKSKGLELGPELVFNGDFSAGGAGWNLQNGASVVNGELVFENLDSTGSAGNSDGEQLIPGVRYLVEVQFGEYTSGIVRVGTGSQAKVFAQFGAVDAISNKTFTWRQEVSSAGRMRISTSSSGAVFVVKKVSVREIKGNHAYQATSTARPILREGDSPSTNYLEFDRVDDFLATNITAFTGTPESVSIGAGVEFASKGGGYQSVFEYGNYASNVNSTVSFGMSGNSPYPVIFRLVGNDNTTGYTALSSNTSPEGKCVATGRAIFGSGETEISINGDKNSSVMPVGNGLIDRRIYLGYRANNSSFFGGKLFDIVFRTRSDHLDKLEDHIGSKLGIFPSIQEKVTTRQVLRPTAPVPPGFFFRDGSDGAWFDPSDLSTVFQDPQCLTPGQLGSPISVLLDKSQNLALGPELFDPSIAPDAIQNGEGGSVGSYDTVTHTMTNSAAGSSPSFPRYQWNLPLIGGKRYKVEGLFSGDIGYISGGGWGVRLSTSGTDSSVAFNHSTGELSGIIEAGSGGAFAALQIATEGEDTYDITIENLSIREVIGNHAQQRTSTARPILGREPRVGRRNLLPKNTGIVGNEYFRSTAVNRTDNAEIDTENGNWHAITIASQSNVQGITDNTRSYVQGKRYTFSVEIKKNIGSPPQTARIYYRAGIGSGDISSSLTVNLHTGVVTNLAPGTGAPTYHDGGIYDLGDSWRLWNTVEVSSTQNLRACLRFSNEEVGTVILVRGFQLEEGDLSPIQQVESNYDITEAGVPSIHYLQFDGVDDLLEIPSFIGLMAGDGTFKVSYFGTSEQQGYVFSAQGTSYLGGLTYRNTVNYDRLRIRGTANQNDFIIGARPISVTVSSTWDSERAKVKWNDISDEIIFSGASVLNNMLRLGAREGGVFFGGKIFEAVFLKKKMSENMLNLLHTYVKNN